LSQTSVLWFQQSSIQILLARVAAWTWNWVKFNFIIIVYFLKKTIKKFCKSTETRRTRIGCKYFLHTSTYGEFQQKKIVKITTTSSTLRNFNEFFLLMIKTLQTWVSNLQKICKLAAANDDPSRWEHVNKILPIQRQYCLEWSRL
jgi:hypothetical protein